MANDEPDAAERRERIAVMMQQYGWAKQRRLMKAAMTVWRRRTTRGNGGRRVSPRVRVH